MSFMYSPNMNLSIPAVGQESGPTYAIDINNSLTLVDQHDHSPGRGVQITPSGMNINADLSIGSNNLTNIKNAMFISQSTSSSLMSLYVRPGTESPAIQDLWYNDSNGTPIQITSGGHVYAPAAAIAGESYSAGTFFWRQGAGSVTPANFDIGSIVIRPNIPATTLGVTVTPPATIASSYPIALPLVPSSTMLLSIDGSGNILSTPPVSLITGSMISGATITGSNIAGNTITGSNIQINTLSGITPSQLDSLTVPYFAQSGSSGSFVTSSSTPVNVTNLSVSQTTSSSTRPTFINFSSVPGTTAPAYIVLSTTNSGGSAVLDVFRTNGSLITIINSVQMQASMTAALVPVYSIPSSSLNCVDFSGGGSTYGLRVRNVSASNLYVYDTIMTVFQV